MSTSERSATSGLGFLAVATLLLTPTNATAEVKASSRALWGPTWLNSRSSLGSVTRLAPILAYASTGGDLHADVVDFRPLGNTGAGTPDESLPERRVTNLAATRIMGEEATMEELYERLMTATVERGYRVARFFLAGADFADSPCDDVILTVYVGGLEDNDARFDLWEALSAEVEDVSSPFLSERLALVVHGTHA